MLKIKEKRPDAIFEAFSNTPPYYMTYSGCCSGNADGGKDNLRPEYYKEFAHYLVDVCKHYKDEYGIEFRTLEPFNESMSSYWYANGVQEGCHFDAASQVAFIKVLAPILKDVPIVNKILPDSATEPDEEIDTEGYSSLKDAVKEVRDLETENNRLTEATTQKDQQIAALEEEVKRLKTFEEKQVEFERIKNEFYNEVVYADNGPGADEYVKYYESMDPATAETLYKQVVVQEQEDKEIAEYAQAYSEMKPKNAAAIFEDMADNLELVAKILWQMEPDKRGAILAAMDPEIAAKLTKIMDPD